jgi:hypothetical protein
MSAEQHNSTQRARATWRARVLNEAQRLEDECHAVLAEGAKRDAIQYHIDHARVMATSDRWIGRFRDWLSGAAFETAWASLHQAEELLTAHELAAELRATTTDLVAELQAGLKPDDLRLAKYRSNLEALAEPSDKDLNDDQRAQIRAARRAANTAVFISQGVVRRWRNLLLLVGVSVAVVVVGLAVVDAFVPEFLTLKGEAASARAGSIEVWEVEAMGAFGGAIAAVLAINRFSGYTDPHGLPLYQALLRIPMAAAVSVVGIVLLQSGIIDGLEPQPPDKLAAYAVLFGYAQEPLLRMIDRRAGEVLGPARGKDDPVKHQARAAPPSVPGPPSGAAPERRSSEDPDRA